MSKYSDIVSDTYRDFFGHDPDPKDPNYQIMKEGLENAGEAGSFTDPDLDLALERLRRRLTEGVEHLKEDAPDTSGNAPVEPGPKTSDSAEENTKAQEAEQTAEEAAPAEPETDPMEDLMALTGLTTIKKDVKELVSFVKTQKLRKEKGMKTVPVSLHLVFTGNPGTGKTTVARLIARIYKQIGVLSKGQLVEVDRSQLVAGYVGQTAIQTQKKIQEAMGGVLFIDEAYTLSSGKSNDFGQEAIDTILKAMEDHRDDFVVIVAGYTDRMETFINSNPGLKSRFNKYFLFPDYTVEEMLEIFHRSCSKYEYKLSDEAETQVKDYLTELEANKGENFANARSVRNYFEFIVTNQARRVAALEDPDTEALSLVLPEDLKEEE